MTATLKIIKQQTPLNYDDSFPVYDDSTDELTVKLKSYNMYVGTPLWLMDKLNEVLNAGKEKDKIWYDAVFERMNTENRFIMNFRRGKDSYKAIFEHINMHVNVEIDMLDDML